MMRRRTFPGATAAPQLAEMQWVLFDNALQKAAPAGNTKPQSDVFITSENVLQVMDRITTLYTGLKA